MEEVSIIGIDLAKNSFQLHGARADGSVAYRKKLSRGKLLSFLALGGRHLFTVDVKQPFQDERLRLGFRLAVGRVDEAFGELIRLPLHARPVPVPERPGEPSPVLSSLDL